MRKNTGSPRIRSSAPDRSAAGPVRTIWQGRCTNAFNKRLELHPQHGCLLPPCCSCQRPECRCWIRRPRFEVRTPTRSSTHVGPVAFNCRGARIARTPPRTCALHGSPDCGALDRGSAYAECGGACSASRSSDRRSSSTSANKTCIAFDAGHSGVYGRKNLRQVSERISASMAAVRHEAQVENLLHLLQANVVEFAGHVRSVA